MNLLNIYCLTGLEIATNTVATRKTRVVANLRVGFAVTATQIKRASSNLKGKRILLVNSKTQFIQICEIEDKPTIL